MKQPTKHALILFLLFWFLLQPLFLAHAHEKEADTQPTPLSAQALQEAMVAQVQDFIERQARTMGLTAEIKITEPRVENLGACADFDVYSSSAAQLRSRMTVSVRCLGPSKWVSHVHAQLTADGFYFTTNRTIEAGESIGLDDLIAHETDVLKLSPHVVTDPSQIIGFIATRRIPDGSTLRSNVLRNPQSIARGQKINTVAQGKGFVVTGEGQAMQAGNPGTRIQVRTPTGQVIQGIVLDANTVEIILF